MPILDSQSSKLLLAKLSQFCNFDEVSPLTREQLLVEIHEKKRITTRPKYVQRSVIQRLRKPNKDEPDDDGTAQLRDQIMKQANTPEDIKRLFDREISKKLMAKYTNKHLADSDALEDEGQKPTDQYHENQRLANNAGTTAPALDMTMQLIQAIVDLAPNKYDFSEFTIEKPQFGDVTLKAWQCTGALWVNFDLIDPGFGILADEMGLGKTITTLASLQLKVMLYDIRQMLADAETLPPARWPLSEEALSPQTLAAALTPPNEATFTPTLITGPLSCKQVWLNELRSFPKFFSAFVWHGTFGHTEGMASSKILPNKLAEFLAWVEKHSGQDPQSMLTCVIAPIDTLRERGVKILNEADTKQYMELLEGKLSAGRIAAVGSCPRSTRIDPAHVVAPWVFLTNVV